MSIHSPHDAVRILNDEFSDMDMSLEDRNERNYNNNKQNNNNSKRGK